MLTDGPELHEIADSPGWDTKQHCTCGFESVSKCEQWKHASDELRAQVETAEAENQQLKSAGLYLDPLDQSATESDTLRVKRAQARDAADLRNAFTEALLARVETAERQRDELAIALDEIDHLTYGWTFARVGSVIDKIRIRARAELAALGWSADRLAALDTPPAKEA